MHMQNSSIAGVFNSFSAYSALHTDYAVKGFYISKVAGGSVFFFFKILINNFGLLDQRKHLLRAFCCEDQSTSAGKEPVLKWAPWLLQAGGDEAGNTY